jgi:hypothetical protein
MGEGECGGAPDSCEGASYQNNGGIHWGTPLVGNQGSVAVADRINMDVRIISVKRYLQTDSLTKLEK